MSINYSKIELSEDQTHFLYEGRILFNKYFKQALKFHPPGIAAVSDERGWFHIDINGKQLYNKIYKRVFGYYNSRAAVIENENWFHIDEKGNRVYKDNYSWCGNFQEAKCTVRNNDNLYFHIDLIGNNIYENKYLYAGDYKDNYACVKLLTGLFVHINKKGERINQKEYFDLGVFHKGYATAKDLNGWHHIDLVGNPLYKERYLFVEPFYNGFSLVETFNNKKIIINEKGNKIIEI